MLTVAIANCVHIYVTLIQRMRMDEAEMPAGRGVEGLVGQVRTGDRKQDAIIESLRVNLQPVFLASLTTTLGFLSMNFSEVPPFRHLGTFVAFGVSAAFLLSVTTLPALLSVLPIRIRESRTRYDESMVALGGFRRAPAQGTVVGIRTGRGCAGCIDSAQ